MLKASKIVVWDRHFSSYHLLAGLTQGKVDFLLRVSEPHRRVWKKEITAPEKKHWGFESMCLGWAKGTNDFRPRSF